MADVPAKSSGPTRALRDDQDRQELATLHAGMCRSQRRTKLGRRATRLNEVARDAGAHWNPMWECVLDARAAATAGEPEAAVVAPFERMLSLVRAACRDAVPLPPAITLELAKTKEQGEASYAVRRYLAEPDDSPRKRVLADEAIRELSDDLTAAQQLRDGLCTERVLHFRTGPTRVE